MSMKKATLIQLIALGISLPLSALAADLTIINNTSADSTSVINNGACSDILGPSGITHPHATNVVPEKVIAKGCIFNKSNCKAEIHMSNNCSGPTVATVIFDIATGIKSVQPAANTYGYIVSGNGFTASFDGGPAGKNWLQKLLGL